VTRQYTVAENVTPSGRRRRSGPLLMPSPVSSGPGFPGPVSVPPGPAPRARLSRARASRSRWLLVETFSGNGHQPSVIAKGRNAVWMVPLDSVMSRSRYVDEVRTLVFRAASEGAPLRAASSDGQRTLIAVPLDPVEGRVHGVQAWIGGRAEQPPVRTTTGAWCLNLASGSIDASAELYRLYGAEPPPRPRPRSLAGAFERLLPQADESRALRMLVRGQAGDEYQGTWMVRRDDGDLGQVTISCRTVIRPGAGPGARPDVVIRGIAQDTSPEGDPPTPGRPSLERQVLLAERRPGTYRVIVHPRTLRPLRWIDPPPPGLTDPDHWTGAGVTATQFQLDEDTSAVLITLSVPSAR
jgi:hypothetical protein